MPVKLSGQNTLLSLSMIALTGLLQFFILDGLPIRLEQNLIDTGLSVLLLLVVLLSISMIFKFYKPDSGFAWYRIAVAAAIAGLYCGTLDALLQLLMKQDSTYLSLLTKSMLTRFAFVFILILYFDLGNWYRQNIQRVEAKNKRNLETEQLAVKAELEALRQQLQPHFLFNSLNSIAALVGHQPDKARQMIQQLSDFLRGTLRRDDKTMSTLRDELAHLDLYLKIERIRFGDRLHILIEPSPLCLDRNLPSLILQPVLENAIKFGLGDSLGQVCISLVTRCTADMLEIEVRNPFDKESHQERRGTGFGFNSLQRRLYLLFGRNDLLQTRTEGEVFLTILKIPQ